MTLEPVQSQQSQNFSSQHIPDTAYHEPSPSYAPEAEGYLYRNSETQENYAYYNKEVSDNEADSPVVYMKSVNLASEKLYNSVISNAYEESHNTSNEQVHLVFKKCIVFAI